MNKGAALAQALLLLSLLSALAEASPPGTCSEVETWLKASDLDDRSRLIVLKTLQDENVVSIKGALEKLGDLKSGDLFEKLPVGTAGILEAHVESTRNVDSRDWLWETALDKAAKAGNMQEVRSLLDKGAGVNLENNKGVTPLMWASAFGHVDIVKALLEKGASVNALDKYGFTALMLAAKRGRTEVVKTLLEEGASVDLQDKDGQSALMYASWNAHVDVMRALIDKGANINLQDKDGKTALYEAAAEGFADVVQLLLDSGANADIQEKVPLGWRAAAMQLAAQAHEFIKVMLTSAKFPATMWENGETALIAAAKRGHADAVWALLEKGANVDLQDKRGRTALMWAAARGHTNVVRDLLDKGANANLKNAGGYTAVDHAEGMTLGGYFSVRNPECVEMLRAHHGNSREAPL